MTRPDGLDGSDALSPGTAVCGRYRIEREQGRGGMATVYLARDQRHDRLVALKMLHPELSGALGTERFLREISIAARLQHPNRRILRRVRLRAIPCCHPSECTIAASQMSSNVMAPRGKEI
jgi:serine/threonine protein kinase